MIEQDRGDKRGHSRRTILKAASAFGVAAPFLALGTRAYAAWPERPVRLLVPFGPAGPVDVIARLLANDLSERLGQNVFVANKPGATCNIGAGLAARSDPDGY